MNKRHVAMALEELKKAEEVESNNPVEKQILREAQMKLKQLLSAEDL